MRKITMSLLGFVVLLFVVSIFLPSEVHVERSTVIKADVSAIFDHVNDLKKWTKWMPWMEMDPDIEITYGSSSSGSGASYSWVGNADVGSGTLTIKESVENKSISTELDFGDMGTGQGSWRFEKTSDGIKVTWAMDSSTDFIPIIGKYFGLFMDGMVGPDFEKGLKNLKELCEGAS
ncbi:SRPBCC family protein [bacterium AH-315-C07]|nr:SRPBCC family protein [bacterium AH-315-C07]